MAATNKTLVFSAVVRGYRDVWKPHENEELVCLFEANNLFDIFAIQTCRKDCENSWSFIEGDFQPNKIPHRQRSEGNSETIKYIL